MNIALDIIVTAVVIASIVSCAKKGFFKTVVSLLCLIATVVIIYVYAQPLGGFLNEKIVSPLLANYALKDSEINAEDNASDTDEDLLLSLSSVKEIFKDEEISFSEEDKEGSTVKEFLVKLLKDSAFIGAVCAGVAAVAISVAVRIAAWLLEKIIGAVLKLPILKEANKGLGAVIGFVNGILLVWILCIVVNLLSSGYTPKEENGSFASEVTEQTYIYKYAEEYNPLLKILE